MEKRISLIIASVLVLALASNAMAMFGGAADISKFCNRKAPRQTLIYVDESALRDGDVNWIKRIDAKLTSTLMPSEKVTIIKVNSDIGTAEEVMSVCWPDYYADEKAQLQDRGMIDSLFSKDALDTLKEEQSVFRSRIKAGLVKVYQDSDKGSIKGESDIMSSLASDEARINQSGIVTRVVVYSDLGDQETPTKGKYSIDFGHAIFYVFGVSGSVSSHSAWEAAFKESNGLLAAFGSDLGISGDAPVEYARYGVEFETTKSKFFGDMVLFVTADGNLQDSYLSINDAIIGRVSLLTGILKSGSSGKMLQAKTVSGLATDEKGESLQVSGPDRLKGTIGHPGAIVTDTTQEALFEIVATPVQ